MANYWLHRVSHEWDVSKVCFRRVLLDILLQVAGYNLKSRV